MIKLINSLKPKFSILSKQINSQKNTYGNVTPKISQLCDIQLLENPNHPLGILKSKMEEFFKNDDFKTPLQKQHPEAFISGYFLQIL